jgi:hypothetical protein
MNFVKSLFQDKFGNNSLTDFLSFFGFAAFLVGSGYLIYSGNDWANYDTFASITGGGGLGAKLGKLGINKAGDIWGKKEGE